MQDLLIVVTFCASIITIISGAITIISFMQRRPVPDLPQQTDSYIAPSYYTPATNNTSPIFSSRRLVKHPVITIGGVVGQSLIILSLVIVVVTSAQAAGATDVSGQTDSNPDAALWGVFFATAGTLVVLIFYICALVVSARLRRWGWFIGILLGAPAGFLTFSGIAIIVFGIWCPADRRWTSYKR